jgi:hypothetical protein
MMTAVVARRRIASRVRDFQRRRTKGRRGAYSSWEGAAVT